MEDVVEEAVLLVPQALRVHRVDDEHEVLDELHLDVGPRVVLRRQDPRHLQHGEGVEGHPAGAVGLLEAAARRQVRAVDRADVVEAEEAAGEEVVALGVHPVDPPGEVHQQLRHQPRQEVGVAAAVDVPHVQRRPGVHRRVRVAERPLVGRQRAVGVLEPLPAHRQQLVLGERRVDVGQRHGVEGEVPGGEPRVLPGVGHREDVLGVDVEPRRRCGRGDARAAVAAGWGRRRASASRRSSRTACPRSSRRRPAAPRAARRRRRRPGSPRRRTRRPPRCGGRARRRTPCRTRASAEGARRRTRTTWVSPGADRQAVPPGRLGADAVGVHRRRARDDVVVDPVLRVRRGVRRAVEPAQVGVVVAEQQVGSRAVGAGVELPGQLAEPRVLHASRCSARSPAGSAARPRRPTTRCCGTTGGAARGASTSPGRRW